jgi:exodeoxyribonuclease VII small subunit
MTSETGAAEFEAAIKELQRIVELLERDDLELDEALSLFETGVTHLRTANTLLGEAKGRIEELIEAASGDLNALPLDLPADEVAGTEDA